MQYPRAMPRARVVFFFKQWGGVCKSETGRELDGQTYDELPKRQPIPVPSLEFRRNALEQSAAVRARKSN